MWCQWKQKEIFMTSWWTFKPGLRICQIVKSSQFVQEGSLRAMHLMYGSRQMVSFRSYQCLTPLNEMARLNAELIRWWVLLDQYLKNSGCPKEYRIKLFKWLHMSKILQSAEVQMTLLLMKELINPFRLLLILVH